MKELGEEMLNNLGYHKKENKTDIFGRVWGITYAHEKQPMKITFDLAENLATIATTWGEAVYVDTETYEAIVRKNKELKNSEIRKQYFRKRKEQKNANNQ